MAIRPSGSFRRYLIASPTPTIDDADLYDRLRDHRFKSIDEQATAEPSIGWVAAGSFASSDFRPENVFLGKTLLLRIRVDRKRLPSNAVKARLSEVLADAGGRMARSERAKIKQEIEDELLRRVVPATMLLDVYWRPQENEALLSSTAASAHDLFCNLFRETFLSTPVQATPTPLAEKAGPPELTAERLLRLTPLVMEA